MVVQGHTPIRFNVQEIARANRVFKSLQSLLSLLQHFHALYHSGRELTPRRALKNVLIKTVRHDKRLLRVFFFSHAPELKPAPHNDVPYRTRDQTNTRYLSGLFYTRRTPYLGINPMMANYITTIYPPISHRRPDDEKHYWSHDLNQPRH